MDDFTAIITRAESQVKLAYGFKEENKHQQAFLFMDQAVNCYSKALYYAAQDDQELYKAVEDCALRYGELREQFREKAFSSVSGVEECQSKEEFLSDDPQLHNLFDSRMTVSSSGSGFQDIIGLAFLKEIMFNCIIMLPNSRFAQRFSERGGGKFDQNILLYGAPGNGKTQIVQAYHQEAKGTRLYKITPADILSKYIGESEKNLDLLFKSANKNRPSIIFFDEMDGLFSSMRRDGNTVSTLNQFLQLMEVDGVQVIGATNYPWEIPEAMLRRFEHIVHVPLPNKEERRRLLTKYIGSEGIKNEIPQLETIAGATKGYSCSDLKRVAKAAIRIPHAAVIKAEYFKKIGFNNKWIPCSNVDTNAVRMNFLDLNPSEIDFPKITAADLRKAVNANSRTTLPESENWKKTLDFALKNGCDGRNGHNRRQESRSITCWTGNGRSDYKLACQIPLSKVEDSQSPKVEHANPNSTVTTTTTQPVENKLKTELNVPRKTFGKRMARIWSIFQKSSD